MKTNAKSTVKNLALSKMNVKESVPPWHLCEWQTETRCQR